MATTSSNAVAVETRSVVTALLNKWADAKVLSYKFSVHAETSSQNRNKVQVIFSKPTPELPAPPAVAHFCFYLDESLRFVTGFTIESDPHFHALNEIRFDEYIIDQVIKRKLLIKQQNLVNLNDEFASTRVPSAILAREEEKRAHDQENLEEFLLEMFQRKDPYNDGRIAFSDFREALYNLHLPGVSRQRRQILFAFAEQDRDEMVDYASFVPIAADVVETLSHIDRSRDVKDTADQMQEAEEAYHVLAAREVDYVIEQLNKLLQPHCKDIVLETSSTTGESEVEHETAIADSSSTTSLGTDSGSQGARDVINGSGDGEEQVEERAREKVSAYVTFQQLRDALESPQLLVSKGEINLFLGLIEVSPGSRVLCSQLGELYPRVRSLIFLFQHECFGDYLEKYLLKQFTNYESGCLQGSSEHLRFRLKQKDFDLVVKDMKKLLLTPYQVMQVLAACSRDRGVDHVVAYKLYVPQIAQFLQEQTELGTVSIKAAALQHSQNVPCRDETRVFDVPSVEELKQTSLKCFEQLDPHRLGMLSSDDFFTSLAEISSLHAMNLDRDTDMAQLYVLADPNATGRVNYLYFVQVLHPLIRFIQQERQIECGLVAVRAQSKSTARVDNEKETKDSK